MTGELFLAVLLGLRHATDPDHVTAVATLALDREGGARRAGALGLAWGAGHAATLCALGLPLVLAGIVLPDAARSAVEVAIGVVIAALAVRLLVRWRRGVFHTHPHVHDGRVHAHPHAHGEPHDHAVPEAGRPVAADHDHPHAAALGRSPLGALGIGALHGVGGSAAAGVLVVAAAPGPGAALAALVLFAAATAASMAAASWLFGLLVVPAARRVEALVPAFGVAALVFGVAYALGAA